MMAKARLTEGFENNHKTHPPRLELVLAQHIDHRSLAQVGEHRPQAPLKDNVHLFAKHFSRLFLPPKY